jgi:hypothetical protein
MLMKGMISLHGSDGHRLRVFLRAIDPLPGAFHTDTPSICCGFFPLFFSI